MPTKLPRLNIVLDMPVYKTIHRLSKKEGLSMSLVARDLIREALRIYEDIYWAGEAEAREKSFVRDKALRHNEVWGD